MVACGSCLFPFGLPRFYEGPSPAPGRPSPGLLWATWKGHRRRGREEGENTLLADLSGLWGSLRLFPAKFSQSKAVWADLLMPPGWRSVPGPLAPTLIASCWLNICLLHLLVGVWRATCTSWMWASTPPSLNKKLGKTISTLRPLIVLWVGSGIRPISHQASLLGRLQLCKKQGKLRPRERKADLPEVRQSQCPGGKEHSYCSGLPFLQSVCLFFDQSLVSCT